MKKIILLLLLATALFGSKILSYNVYDRHDRVDIMLTFDTPYEGVLRQNQQGNLITIKLEEASIDSPINKTIASTHLQNISISPIGEQLQITANVNSGVVLQASKTSDSYGLRLRFSPPASINKISTQDSPEGLSLPTKNASEFERSYYVVIGILVIGIIILFWLKHSINKKAAVMHTEPRAPWLSPSSLKKTLTPNTAASLPNIESGGVKIRFQKTLDPAHSVAMLDFGTQSYLVLLGNNTLLLDKFQDNIPVTQNDFETLLHSKHQELDGFFQLGTTQDESFNSYKEKASGEY